VPSTEVTRWAVVGAGFMLRLIARDFALTENVRLQVVVARDPDRAVAAAAAHGIPEASDDLAAVLSRDDIDVVYVATPHSKHARIARAAMEAGKSVLVEKPLTTSATDTRALCATARERGLFLMEAMWTAFAPAVVDLRERVSAGEIGEVLHLSAGFCLAFPPDSGRLWDPRLGGGTTLDQGVYGISLAHMVLGAPTAVTALGTMRAVDEEAVVVLDHDGGARAVCTSSMRAHGQTGAVVAGTAGSIEILGPFWGPNRLLVRRGPAVGEAEEIVHDREGAGYVPMLRAVSDAVLSGGTEHPLRSHADSIAVAETMDLVLAQLRRSAAATPGLDAVPGQS
jgi:predicted dehydrogenase